MSKLTKRDGLNPLMNNTKWDEVRLAMYDMPSSPSFIVHDVDGKSWPDSEWFYHFRVASYDTILATDILFSDEEQRKEVLSRLRAINVPGEILDDRVRVLGYSRDGQEVHYV